MGNLSQSVQDLIRRAIDSVETLELLLLLRRSPNSYWTAAAAEQSLGLKPGVARQRYESLVSAGLVTRGATTGAYRYDPVDDDIRQTADELATAYVDQRIQVINLIYSASLERLRAFSSAFRLKGDS